MIVLIIKHDFDSLENFNPEVTSIVGFKETEEEANKWIEEAMKIIHIQQGYDGKIYPYYTTLQIYPAPNIIKRVDD